MSDLRDKIAGALNNAGAQCGWCSREPGEPLSECGSCSEVLNRYADAVLAVLNVGETGAEALHRFRGWVAQVRAEAKVETLRQQADEFYHDGEREWDGYRVSRALTIDADRMARTWGIEAGESND